MLSTEQLPGITTLTLQRPERGNALGPELVEALISAAEAAIADPAVHTLVLRGAGRHFCTGLDLSDLATLSDGDLLLRLVRIETLLALLWHAPIRTVALAHGRTWGAGADLFANDLSKVCRQLGLTVVDGFILADQTADISKDAPRLGFLRRISQALRRIGGGGQA